MEHLIGRGTGAPYGEVISTREGNVGALAPLIPFCINTVLSSRNAENGGQRWSGGSNHHSRQELFLIGIKKYLGDIECPSP